MRIIDPICATRFWTYVDKSGGAEACWNWTGGRKSDHGYGFYGRFRCNGYSYDAHRFSWILTIKQKPELSVLHKCHNKLCVNPTHLYEGTQSDNRIDVGLAWQGLRGGSRD